MNNSIIILCTWYTKRRTIVIESTNPSNFLSSIFKKIASEFDDAWSSNDYRKGSRAYVHLFGGHCFDRSPTRSVGETSAMLLLGGWAKSD